MTVLEQILLAGYPVMGAVIAYLFKQLQKANARESAVLREVLPLAQELPMTVASLQVLVEKLERGKREEKRGKP